MPDSKTTGIEWVSAGLAPNEFTATLWRDILSDAGIDAYLKPIDAATFLIAAAILPVNVMVPKERLEEAKSILADVKIVDQASEPSSSDEAGSGE
ncbi:Putative signal transducing protein [Dehalogenimonas formicexedens]|uniref:Signal transducing protein n=1 Tax=Dehalogenimonas formicexedens TaxID=1839801 RepID=A0A1P8FAI9_9CHLR|nr:DUF2007 domain-containing protein [Dehalogenimonas formicexedens]APV45464.1 Putative signal transducing protein [Dehalogenimonas formicexedens]